VNELGSRLSLSDVFAFERLVPGGLALWVLVATYSPEHARIGMLANVSAASLVFLIAASYAAGIAIAIIGDRVRVAGFRSYWGAAQDSRKH
jgi:hypothetical protein